MEDPVRKHGPTNLAAIPRRFISPGGDDHNRPLSSLGSVEGDRYRLIVDGLEEGVVVHDANGIIRSCNPSAERILNVPTGALLGKTSVLQLCDPVNEEGAPFPLSTCPALVSLRTARSYRGILVGIREPMGIRWLSFNSHPLSQEDGTRAGVVTSFHDVTEARQREEESRLRYDEAKLRIKLHDDFLATAAHELKTPLTALKLSVQTLLHTATQGAVTTRERLAIKLCTMARQADRLNSFVDLLLDATRITAGRLKLERSELDMAGLVEEVVARQFDLQGASRCEVRVETKKVRGMWDPTRLEQVVANLLNNAVKYGEGKPVIVSVHPLGDDCILEVRDSGPGIAPEDQQRIFSRFERAAVREDQPGLGLGLWIVRQIVEAHGGQIGLISKPGAGALFTVTLPIQPKGNAQDASSDESGQREG